MHAAFRNPRLAALLLVLITAAAFWPGLSGSFLFDDFPNVLQNEQIQITTLDAETIRRAAASFESPSGRPVAMASLAVDYFFWGQDPWGFKLTNLLVHALNAVLVLLLVTRLFAVAGTRGHLPVALPFLVALLWAIHPLQVSTVLYVVQRMELMAFSFVLMALLCYLKGRAAQISGQVGWPWLAACVPLALLGLLCKESAALLPLFTLALELTVLGFAAMDPVTSRRWRGAYGLGSLAALVFFAFVVVPYYSAFYEFRDFTVGERLLTQLRALPMYLGWILLPNPGGYLFYYDHFAPSTGLLHPVTTLAGGMLLAALVALALWLRKRLPLISLGLLWFLAAHALTSNVVPLELVFEHRNYFAVLGVLLAVFGLTPLLPTTIHPRMLPLVGGVLATGVFGLTLIHSANWGNPLHLALELASKNPLSARASADLGEQYMILAGGDANSRFYPMAMQEFERGAAIPGASPMPEHGLIILAASAGRQAKDEWWASMIHKLRTRAVGPQEVSMLTGLLNRRNEGLEFDDKRFSEAYLVSVERLDMPPSQYFAYGLHAINHLKDPGLAQFLFRMAADKGREDPVFVAALVELLANRGHRAQATELAEFAASSLRIKVQVPEPPPQANTTRPEPQS